MYSDTHMHTDFSGDCHTPATLQVEQAIQLGMKEICITDHHDCDVTSDVDFTLDIDRYLPFMNMLKNAYEDQIRINIGIELGLQYHINDDLEHLLKAYSFDYVIGSSHFIDGLDPYYPDFFEGRTERQAYERYFESTLNRVQHMNCFDCLGHLDYVVRYGPDQNRHYSFERYQEYIDPILKTLVDKGKGLECNTGGLKYGLGHPNPSEDILKRYRELGGEILTIGADAHRPKDVGFGFDQLHDLLTGCGFQYYTVFHDRKPVFCKL